MTNALPSAVSAEITLRLVVDLDRSIEVPCSLEYRAEEPYAVFATFQTGMADIEWTFARDLIADGLRRPSGEGDVVVWPEFSGPTPVVLVALNSPSGQALLEADSHLVEAFLDRTYDLVPHGSESMQLNVDRWIAQILGEGVNEF
jgi:hypothetical protein